jgi:UDP-glucose 4-epimerase
VRVVVFGATGNVGTAVVEALAADPAVDEVVGVSRRAPGVALPGVRWHEADVAGDPLDVVAGADVVVHLAWMIQPQHRPAVMLRTNVVGTRRVVDAVLRHGVRRIVVASSVGTYAPGPKDVAVDERWPATGIPTSTYSQHKAMVEEALDEVEDQQPGLAIVRMRTSLVFQRRAGAEVHRLFLGPLAPRRLPGPLRLAPSTARLVFQATHAADVAEAYRLAVHSDVRGPLNVAAAPVLDPARIAAVAGARTVPVPAAALRAAAAASFHLRLQRSEPGWLDMALGTPIMDCSRIRRELGWVATRTAEDALRELLAGMGEGAGAPTPPLHAHRGGPNLPLEVAALARGARAPDRPLAPSGARDALP